MSDQDPTPATVKAGEYVICGTGMDPNVLNMPGPGVPPRPQAPKPTLAAAILRLLNR